MIIFMFRLGGSVNGRGATPNISHLWKSEVTSKTKQCSGKGYVCSHEGSHQQKKTQWTITILDRRYIFKWLFSIAMLVPRKVATQEKDTFELIFVGLTVKVSFFSQKNVVPCFFLAFAKLVPTTCFWMFVLRQNILQTRLFVFFLQVLLWMMKLTNVA